MPSSLRACGSSFAGPLSGTGVLPAARIAEMALEGTLGQPCASLRSALDTAGLPEMFATIAKDTSSPLALLNVTLNVTKTVPSGTT